MPDTANSAVLSREPVSTRLAAMLSGSGLKGDLTLNRILARAEAASVDLLIILLALPFVIPVSVPGLSPILGTMIIFLAIAQASGRTPRLPSVLGERKLPPHIQTSVLGGSVKVLQIIEKVARPRRTQWMSWPVCRIGHGLLLAVLGFLLALPLPSPPFFFSNSIPSYAIIVLAASIMEEDGVLIWIAYLLTFLNFVFFSFIGGVAIDFVMQLLQRLFLR